ncbi:hypothetical protein [Paraglaciecola sp. 2405UD69-4]|uniref:hypothetical protein n=1 Tax=Paraglaciecola sp. 2405UD69-4 TaxID=3391836 RepID=UPI0039C8F5CA
MKINWSIKIGNKAGHNAFVDVCHFNNWFYCCYREATNHISADGKICILKVDHQGVVLNRSLIQLPSTDLRDPKLTITPDGKMLLIAYARRTNSENRTIGTRNLCWVSQTGDSWSTHKEFAEKGWWLWRITWHQGLGYGFAYNRKQNAINFFTGDPRRSFHRHVTSAFSLKKHGKGYPNESDIIFNEKTAYAIIRRDADSYTAQLGISNFPYKRWKWTDLQRYIGGPALIKVNAELAILAGRIFEEGKLVTGVFTLNLNTAKLIKQLVLPSQGDNSYPGLVIENDKLYICYYSSHEDNKSSVYMTELDIYPLKE